MQLKTLKEAIGDPPAAAFLGQASTYANYNVGWPEDGGATVSHQGKKVWVSSAAENKKLTSMGKFKLKNDTSLIRYLIAIGIL